MESTNTPVDNAFSDIPETFQPTADNREMEYNDPEPEPSLDHGMGHDSIEPRAAPNDNGGDDEEQINLDSTNEMGPW